MILWVALAPLMLVVGVVFLIKHYRRELATLTLRDARLLTSIPATTIAQIQSSGLVKIVGVARGPYSVMSYFDRVPCLAHRMVTTTHEGTTYVGNVATQHFRISREWQLFPFQVDDGTGVVSVDPRGAVIDFEVAHPDEEGSVQEHRIRLGDRVALIGPVEVTPLQSYRDGAPPTAERVRFTAPPLVSWRSDPEFYPRLRPPPLPVALIVAGLAGIGGALLSGMEPALVLILTLGPPLMVAFVAGPVLMRMGRFV